MKYFYCYDCGEVFSEEAARIRLAEDGYGLKEVYGCPECGSTNITDANECKICGAPIRATTEYCQKCNDLILKRWERVIEAVQDRRIEEGDKLSAEYFECRDALVEWLEDKRVF